MRGDVPHCAGESHHPGNRRAGRRQGHRGRQRTAPGGGSVALHRLRGVRDEVPGGGRGGYQGKGKCKSVETDLPIFVQKLKDS